MSARLTMVALVERPGHDRIDVAVDADVGRLRHARPDKRGELRTGGTVALPGDQAHLPAVAPGDLVGETAEGILEADRLRRQREDDERERKAGVAVSPSDPLTLSPPYDQRATPRIKTGTLGSRPTGGPRRNIDPIRLSDAGLTLKVS